MDFEALLLGVEPAVAFGVGLTALAFGSAMSALGNTEVGKSLTESGRTLTKNGIKWGIETVEKVQGTVAEAGETWNDLVAEAQLEIKTGKNTTQTAPKEVEIAG